MTLPLFLADNGLDPHPGIGDRFALTGSEGRHAAVVRRIGVGESVVIGDGTGRGIEGVVVEAGKSGLVVDVVRQLLAPEQKLRFVAAQALAKGDRGELAIEMLTELGVDAILPWQSARSIVRWSGERAEKSHQRWQSTVREAAKQARRLRTPEVRPLASTRELAVQITDADLALILHEDAAEPIAAVGLPESGSVLIVIGPEGGISDDELSVLTAAGGRPVKVGDNVLRTSTAGVVALAALMLPGVTT